MIILTNTTDKVQVKLGATVTTNQLPCFASYRDVTTTSISPLRNVLNTNNVTAVDLVDSPASSTQRIVDYISVYNNDTVNATVTVQFSDNGTLYTLCVVVLGASDKLEYQEGIGFNIINSSGSVSSAENSALPTSTSNVSFVIKSTDQTSTVTTFADITGLSFAVTSGKTYWFKFYIPYTSNATGNGGRFAVSGPASPTVLYYYVDLTLTATTKSYQRGITTYDGAAAAGTSLVAGNLAIIEGVVKPSANGTLIARFASEVAAGNSIVQKTGAFVQYMEI